MRYQIEESIGNYAKTVDTMDTLEEAEQAVYDLANNDLANNLDMDLELCLSYYAITEVD